MVLCLTSINVVSITSASFEIIMISERDSGALYNLINFIIGIRLLITITQKVYINTFKVCCRLKVTKLSSLESIAKLSIILKNRHCSREMECRLGVFNPLQSLFENKEANTKLSNGSRY